MQIKTVYVCNTCGYESLDFNEMKQHEADHLGLTLEEMDFYKTLKSDAEFKGYVVSNRNNEETRREFDEAIERLVDFEKAHNIKS